MRGAKGLLFLLVFFSGVGVLYVVVDIQKKRVKKKITQKKMVFRQDMKRRF